MDGGRVILKFLPSILAEHFNTLRKVERVGRDPSLEAQS
jgi:hypothetical protein